ncbi:MAG: hypothetical protein D6731_07145 [Planctomycetota bacterium]|nr:MAG: hypothetical protein D6731_07145 [Planctomycetota bacterium]
MHAATRPLAAALVTALLADAPARAGSAERAAQALFEGRLDPARAVKVWKRKGLTPARALALIQGLLPYRRGKHGDDRLELVDRHGRRSRALVHVPDSPRPDGRYGVLVALHGLGSDASQLFRPARALAPPGTIVIAPSAVKPWEGLEYEDLRAAGALAKLPILKRVPHWWSYRPDAFPLLALDQVLARYPVDTARIVLLGYSMGGFGTWNLGLRYHERFAGLAPLAGGISRQEYLFGKDELSRRLLDNARGLPAFFAHGDADSVVPVRFDRWTAERLRAVDADFVYQEVPGGRHVLGNLLASPLRERLVSWIAARQRDDHPRVVRHRCVGLYHPGAFWVEITALRGDSARVEARAEGDEVVLEAENVAGLVLYLDPEVIPTDRRVTVTYQGKVLHRGKVAPSLWAVARSFARTRDPRLVYAHGLKLKLPAARDR